MKLAQNLAQTRIVLCVWARHSILSGKNNYEILGHTFLA
jgi:hypothetical protein